MIILLLENHGNGLNKTEILHLLARNDAGDQIPDHLQKHYGNFGYAYTLGRSFEELAHLLVLNGWATKDQDKRYHLTLQGLDRMQALITEMKKSHIRVATYGLLDRSAILATLEETRMNHASIHPHT